ncbi:hypothetical protein CsatA_020320 [Cannabis sativa]
MKSLFIQVLTGRWLMVFASFLLMVTAGASYMFGLYSNDIKSVLGYDQTTLNLLSFSKDLGANIGILSGLINEVTPPWVVLSIGAILNFFGNFMIWLAVSRKISDPKLWHMCLYIAIGANSHTFTNTGALVTCVKNFPESRGVVLGLLKGYTGISAAVIAQLYRALYGDDTSFFTLFVAWLPTALSFAFIKTIRIIETTNRPLNDVKVFYKFLYISMSLAGFLFIIIILEKSFSFNKTEYSLSAAGVLFLLFLPIIVVFREEDKLLKTKLVSRPQNNAIVVSPSVQPKESVSWWKDTFKQPQIGEDHTIPQALLSIEMITLLLATVCGLGGSMTMMDNLGQIGTSFGYPLKRITNFVSLTSIWNYLGQITVGILSEIFITKKRPHSHIHIGESIKSTPVARYSTPLGVTGYYYDKEARKQMASLGLVRKPGEALNCLGRECFKLSFIIITVVTVFGAVVSLFLVARTRKFYQGDIYKKFRVETVNTDNNKASVSVENVVVAGKADM